MSSSATTVARSEPLTALPRSARSRVSSVAALHVACEDTSHLPTRCRKCAGSEN